MGVQIHYVYVLLKDSNSKIAKFSTLQEASKSDATYLILPELKLDSTLNEYQLDVRREYKK